MFHSPLAERRLAISLLKKHLLGRRAYSDSIYRKIAKNPSPLNTPPLVPKFAAQAQDSPK